MTRVPAIVNIGGVDVTAFQSLDECAAEIEAAIDNRSGGAAFAVNAEKVVSCLENTEHQELVRQATLRYPDGAGVVLAMRKYSVRTARTPGVELWLAVLRRFAGRSLSVALIGARPEVLASTQQKLESEFPNLRIRYSTDGFDGARDVKSVAMALMRERPELVLVAMGSPRQERLIVELRCEHPAAYYMGLGGSFDVYCGLKTRAPAWMQRVGLEWTYRFLQEPSRGPREMKRLKFLALLIAGRI